MGDGAEGLDKDKEKWLDEERRVFRGRVDSFIARMHLVQGMGTISILYFFLFYILYSLSQVFVSISQVFLIVDLYFENCQIGNVKKIISSLH